MQEYLQFVEAISDEIRVIADFIHAHPELGFEEFQAADKIAAFLERHGFAVTRQAAGIATAIRADMKLNAADNAPRVCVCGEYDALPGLGHGCGHNLIAAAGLSAAWIAAKYAEKHHLDLNLCFMGTPAEEGKGGKVKMIKGGAFADVAMAVMAHPSERTETDSGFLGVARARISFHGKASHAGSAPERGINALDAMVFFYADMLEWKKAIGTRERVHGIITNGGDAPNIIPDLTQAFFYVRAATTPAIDKLKKALDESVRRGATKAGCRYDIEWDEGTDPILVNRPINLEYQAAWRDMGEDIPLCNGDERCGSTDMGNVTQIMPGAHVRFAISDGEPCPGHSIAFREAAAGSAGFANAIKAGAAMARILIRYSQDQAFRTAVNADFQQHRHK